MAVEPESVRQTLMQIVSQVEDLWIECESLKAMAAGLGYTPEELDKMRAGALANPENRKIARLRFEWIRKVIRGEDN